MKRSIAALVLLLVVVSGLVFANRGSKHERAEKSATKPVSAAEEIKPEPQKWEDTPEGMRYKKWESSAEGKKVLAGAAKLNRLVSDSANMEAVITSLSLPPGSRLGFGVMARSKGEDYILSFGLEEAGEFQPLHSLKVNDRIIIRSHGVSHAPKYAYPIVSGDYVERDSKILYKRPPRKGGC